MRQRHSNNETIKPNGTIWFSYRRNRMTARPILESTVPCYITKDESICVPMGCNGCKCCPGL